MVAPTRCKSIKIVSSSPLAAPVRWSPPCMIEPSEEWSLPKKTNCVPHTPRPHITQGTMVTYTCVYVWVGEGAPHRIAQQAYIDLLPFSVKEDGRRVEVDVHTIGHVPSKSQAQSR